MEQNKYSFSVDLLSITSLLFTIIPGKMKGPYTLRKESAVYLAVPIGKPFKEPCLILDRTGLSSMWNPLHRWFYMEPKIVLPETKKGYPMGRAKEPFRNPFF